MFKFINQKYFSCLIKSSLLFLFFSCENSLDSIKKISFKSSDPNERTSDLNVIYTDSGYAKVEIFAKLAETYSKPERVVKLKDGIKVNFFDDNGEILSVLTALYGEVYESRGEIMVKDSVQLRNINKKQLLETEELHWSQKDSTIFTEKPVVVRTSEALFFGKGIKTKHDFSTYEFLKPEGKINIKN
jgi:LPS export ABC transporter protein LptC